MIRLISIAMFTLALSVMLVADVLVMRDGTRVQGELIAVRNGVIEFEERRGFGRGRLLRLDRDEVSRIEFDNAAFDDRDFSTRGRPGGLRERQVTISANVPWNDTGVEVRAGQTVYFEATGTVRWGRDRRDGPAGENNSPSNPARPMPNRPAAALIGKVGGASSDFFFIGDDPNGVRMRSSGRLFLGINDDFLGDNTGNFRVIVHH